MLRKVNVLWRWVFGMTVVIPLAGVWNCSGSSATPCVGGPCASDDGGSGDDGFGDAGVEHADNDCPWGRGPDMVKVPVPAGGAFCIDSTEVTNAQYGAFLADTTYDAGSDVGGPLGLRCAGHSLTPGATPGCSYDPVLRADYPVACVDTCDAIEFCAWAGKRLCGSIGGQPILTDPALGNTDIDAASVEWLVACTSGGKHGFVYGDAFDRDACVVEPQDAATPAASLPVGSRKNCQSPEPAYQGVFDLIGNVRELTAWCHSGCQAFGGAYAGDWTGCLSDYSPEQTGSASKFPDIGFRCCADAK